MKKLFVFALLGMSLLACQNQPEPGKSNQQSKEVATLQRVGTDDEYSVGALHNKGLDYVSMKLHELADSPLFNGSGCLDMEVCRFYDEILHLCADYLLDSVGLDYSDTQSVIDEIINVNGTVNLESALYTAFGDNEDLYEILYPAFINDVEDPAGYLVGLYAAEYALNEVNMDEETSEAVSDILSIAKSSTTYWGDNNNLVRFADLITPPGFFTVEDSWRSFWAGFNWKKIASDDILGAVYGFLTGGRILSQSLLMSAIEIASELIEETTTAQLSGPETPNPAHKYVEELGLDSDYLYCRYYEYINVEDSVLESVGIPYAQVYIPVHLGIHFNHEEHEGETLYDVTQPHYYSLSVRPTE